MNIDFSDEQKLLLEQAMSLLTAENTLQRTRTILDNQADYDAELWQKICEMGWTATSIPEPYGGLGLGHLELCVIAEALGHHLAPVPFSSSIYLAAGALLAFGSEQQKQTWLPDLASGAKIGTLALAEQPGPVTAQRIGTTFSNGKLTGTKIAVPDGNIADILIVAARAGDKVALYLLDTSTEGVSRTPQNSVDPAHPIARLDFDACQAELLEESDWDGLQRLLDQAAVLFAFEQIAGAQRVLEMGRDYALERKAFGRQIGSFQAIKHKLADMYISVTLARANAYYGAWALSSDAPELPIAAATARVSATQAYNFCTAENIQTHGGMGYTWEFDCHLFYRRARGLALNIGSENLWKEKLIAAISRSNQAAA